MSPEAQSVALVPDDCGWQLDPRVAPTLVDRVPGRREARVPKGAHGHAHRRMLEAFFGVEHGAAADGTEVEAEPRALIAGTDELGRDADDLVGFGEGSQRREDAAGAALTLQAMTEACSQRLDLHHDLQLAETARSGT